MVRPRILSTLVVAVCLCGGLGGCAVPSASSAPEGRPEDRAPDWSALSEATIELDEIGSIVLDDGTWESEPFVEGGSARHRVSLVRDFARSGDLDHDGIDEGIGLLSVSSGGSGTLTYILMADHADGALKTATSLIGDRVQIRRLRVEAETIRIELVQPGPDDAACCPGELATRRWTLESGALVESEPEITGRLDLETLDLAEWAMTHWDWDEPAPAEPEATVVRVEGAFSGASGCNRYNAAVSLGEMPGDLVLGPAMSTRMACPGQPMEFERRFLDQLGGVTKFGFQVERLALSYEVDGRHGVMLFSPRALE